MRSRIRRILIRFGLTGKILLCVGGMLAISLGLLVALAWWGAARTIRHEMERTQRIRVMEWASAHLEVLEAEDRWALAGAIENLSDDPYVLYAAIFDRTGMPVAQTGSDRARDREHTLDFIQILRSGSIRDYASAPPGARPGPLAGLPASPARARPGAAFRDRFASVLGDQGNRTEDLVAFVEITLDTGPLDHLASSVMLPLAFVSLLLLASGLTVTFVLARRIASPLQMLTDRVDRLARGEGELRFNDIPRPLDEVGALATRLSVLAGGLDRGGAEAGRPGEREDL